MAAPNLPPSAPAPYLADADLEELAHQAGDLLAAIASADTTPEGEPVLAAAGLAATAALLLLQGDTADTVARLCEVYDVTSDQLAIVRELLHEASVPGARPPAPQTRQPRHRAPRRRRLRLVTFTR
jgi:hypothetical protein